MSPKRVSRQFQVIALAITEIENMPPDECKEITVTGFALLCSKISRQQYSVKEFKSIIEKSIFEVVLGRKP